MPDSKGVEERICEMLDMGDEELLVELQRYFQLSDELHQRISDTMDEMMLEVDDLISRIDRLDDELPEDEGEESSPR
jgi:hypothetical protein